MTTNDQPRGEGADEGREPHRIDKRELVLRALAERGHLSDRSIAKLCGVSHPFVSKLRRLLTVAAAPREGLVAGNDDDADVHPDLVNPPGDDAGIDPDLADAASDPALDASRTEHARLLSASVQANTALPTVASPLEAFEPRDGADAAPPAAPQNTFVSLMGIPFRTPDRGEEAALAETGEGATRIVSDDVPVFQEGDASDPAITVITRPAPRAAPDTRELPEQVYADEHRALQKRLHNEQLHHGRLLEKVARGEATAADLARSRGNLRDLKDQLEDVAALAEHTATVARERAERARVERYYATVDRTEAEFAQLVETLAAMDGLVAELGAARARCQTLLEGALVDLRSQAAKMRDDPQRRLLAAISTWTSQANALEGELLHRLRAVCALRDQGVDPATVDHRLDAWAGAWTRPAIEMARAHGPRLPDPESASETAGTDPESAA